MRYMRSPVLLVAITSALLGATFTVAPFPAHAAVNRPVMVPEPRPLALPEPQPAKPHSWTVKSGQSLTTIAAAAYGDSSLWPALWWVNKAHVRNPDMIRTGQVLKLSQWHPHAAWLDHAASHARPAPVVVVATTVQRGTHRVYHRTYHRSYTASGTYHGSGSMEQCIIRAESGGNSQVMNSSGHYGLYQFSYSTWVASGGSPSSFGHASVAEQQSAFRTAVAARGYSDWTPYDGC